MRIWTKVCAVLVLLLSCVSGASAACVSSATSVTYPGVNPNRAAAAIAFSGTTFLVAKHEARSNALYVALYDKSFQQVTPDTLVASSARLEPMTAAWNGTDFGLFFQSIDGSQFYQRVSASGSLGSAPVMLQQGEGPDATIEYDVAWNAVRTAYMYVYAVPFGGNRGLWLATLDPSGSVTSRMLVTPLSVAPTLPHVAAMADGNTLVFFRNAAIGKFAVQSYDRDGSFLAVTATLADPGVARVVSNGSTAALITSVEVSGGSEIRWTRVNSRGQITGREAKLFTAKGVDAAPVAVAWNADDQEFGLIYRDSVLGFLEYPGDLRLGRFRFDGSLVYDSLLSPDPSKKSLLSRDSAVWDGTSYVTPIGRLVSYESGYDSYLARNCTLRATILTQTVIPYLATTAFRADVSGGSGPFTYRWDMGDSTPPVFGPNITYRYIVPGPYVVKLTVTDSTGAVVSTSTTVMVGIAKRRAVQH